MPPVANFTARGHSEVGHVAGGDQSWGKTSEEGVSLQLEVQSVDLLSAQSLMEIDTGITRAQFNLAINLIETELNNWVKALGLPAGALVGDNTSTPEVLSISDTNLGSQERALYSLGPGPNSTRRIDVQRSKLANVGPMQQGKLQWMQLQTTWRALQPPSGAVVTITDAL